MKLVTIEEAAAQLGVTPQMVRRYCKEGLLQAQRLGKAWVITGEVRVPEQKRGRPVGAANKPKLTGAVQLGELRVALKRVRPVALIALHKRAKTHGIAGVKRDDAEIIKNALHDIAQTHTREKTHKAHVAVLQAALAAIDHSLEPSSYTVVTEAEKIARALSREDQFKAERDAERAKNKAMKAYLTKARAKREARRKDAPAIKTNKTVMSDATRNALQEGKTLKMITERLSAIEGYNPAEIDLLAETHGYDVGLVTRPYIDEPHDKNPFVSPRLPAALRNDPRMGWFSQRWNDGLRRGLAAQNHKKEAKV